MYYTNVYPHKLFSWNILNGFQSCSMHVHNGYKDEFQICAFFFKFHNARDAYIINSQ